MNDIFEVAKLLVKKKMKALTSHEKQSLKKLEEKFPFAKKISYGKILNKISYYDTLSNKKGWKSIKAKQSESSRSASISLVTKSWLKYAAIIIVLLGLGSFIYTISINSSFFNNQISNDLPKVVLKLENGSFEEIDTNKKRKILDAQGKIIGTQKGEKLIYGETIGKDNGVLIYNELIVPNGRKMELLLSDGTYIYVNSGSTIKYPVRFIDGQERQIFLKGEAFFDVAKDTTHSFIVNAKDIDVQVLGTKFNMSAYEDDDLINTVLVEGSVNVNSIANKALLSKLEPGYMASWNKDKETLNIESVNTEIHTSWIDGKLIFEDVPFKEITKKLERHYNVIINYDNKELESERFDAKFDIETIEEVFETFAKKDSLQFTIEDNLITIY
ncbi:FecR domain-containing protein [Tamlana sp. 2201CG12-4]|uniref:FecR family protein n=1 Tax=Tamlana sp. 2201CG12-4 TaxID=3112582 RepID=UPI002DB6B81E|nr:FecR domain-containing protein [Tamlana sp. 2201CG12-4]MEC3906676.1 FecR domain-containing protein [Tamlana sp. 2201CG12-4]